MSLLNAEIRGQLEQEFAKLDGPVKLAMFTQANEC